MQKLKDKVVLITGANRGIGKALVAAVLEKGVGKVYATCRDSGKMPVFNDPRVVVLELDITDEQQIEKVVQRALDAQVLINNAGVVNAGTILDAPMADIEEDMKVNYYGTLHMMKAFKSVLEQNSPSALVNITSITAYSPLPLIAGYSASKAALHSATHSARIELAKKGVTVFTVNPGAIDTDMNKGSDWDMPSPEVVAKVILDKMEDGVLDIVPDDMGLGMYNAWREDPKRLAEMFHGIYHEEK